MSQITADYGDDLVGGILAGQKFKQFQSDLKTSEIQRHLLEQSLQHNQIMQPLLQAHQQAENENAQITNQNLSLAHELAKRTFEPKAQLAQAEADTAKAGADVASATKQGQIDYTKARTGTAQAEERSMTIKALQELGGSLAGSHQFSDQDLEQLLTQNNMVGSGKADMSLMTHWARQGIEQGNQKLDENKAKINMYQSEMDKNSRAKMTYDFATLSDMASQNPEGFAAAKDQLKQMYHPDMVEAAGTLGVEAANRKSAAANATITTSPGDIKLQQDLAGSIKELTDKLYTEKQNKLTLEQGRNIPSKEDNSFMLMGGLSRKQLVKQSQERVDQIQSQIDEIKTQLAPVNKTITKSGAKGTTAASTTYPPEVLEWAKKNLPAGKALPPPTPELIAQWSDYVKKSKK